MTFREICEARNLEVRIAYNALSKGEKIRKYLARNIKDSTLEGLLCERLSSPVYHAICEYLDGEGKEYLNGDSPMPKPKPKKEEKREPIQKEPPKNKKPTPPDINDETRKERGNDVSIKTGKEKENEEASIFVPKKPNRTPRKESTMEKSGVADDKTASNKPVSGSKPAVAKSSDSKTSRKNPDNQVKQVTPRKKTATSKVNGEFIYLKPTPLTTQKQNMVSIRKAIVENHLMKAGDMALMLDNEILDWFNTNFLVFDHERKYLFIKR